MKCIGVISPNRIIDTIFSMQVPNSMTFGNCKKFVNAEI